MASIPRAFSMLEGLAEPDRDRVRRVVATLTRGMEMDLTTFPSDPADRVVALKTFDQLDEYTYLVAGCVGEFWTEMTMAHIPGLRDWDAKEMSVVGVRFGKALQLTNVLRDVPKDLRIGRCYLPNEAFSLTGVSPLELLDPEFGARARPTLVRGIEIALDHYRVAESYLYAIPTRYVRLRLAVAWPLLMGLGTLAELAKNPRWLDPSHRSKVARPWVYRMMAFSIPAVASNGLLRSWAQRLRRDITRAL